LLLCQKYILNIIERWVLETKILQVCCRVIKWIDLKCKSTFLEKKILKKLYSHCVLRPESKVKMEKMLSVNDNRLGKNVDKIENFSNNRTNKTKKSKNNWFAERSKYSNQTGLSKFMIFFICYKSGCVLKIMLPM
jgi:hypothetical protein